MNFGFHEAAHATAFGKFLLAGMSSEQRDQYLDVHGLGRLTPTTKTARADLLAELVEVGNSGVAWENEEFVTGQTCAAVGVRNGAGMIVSSVAIRAPSGELTPRRRSEVERHLRDAAAAAARAKLAAATPATVFALDADGDLVRLPAVGDTATTVAADVTAYAVDATATSYAVTPAGLVRVSGTGATTSVLTSATAAASSAVALDAAGTVYISSGTRVFKVLAGTTKAIAVATLPVAPVGFGVAPNGTVRVLENVAGAHQVVAYTTSGRTATRAIADSAYSTPVSGTFDAKGNLYYASISTGGSVSVSCARVAKGGTAPVSLGGGYVVGGVGLSGDFSLLQAAGWCTSYGLGSGTCTPDLAVAAVQSTDLAGTTTSIPVDSLALATDDERFPAATTSVTTDTAGALYVGQTTGLVRYDAAGGAPTRLADGAFTEVQLTK
ncbi:transcriptional regulator [Frondihabitans sp. PhB188]|uniref:IclR family transcriptional regulator domain-containing protein n=1 Tax=Frondihabitans sp. PhB188 TaxID=2485200 RepID=UPI000F4830CD|nr:IclR family transcriptional regulator C-terminal domain-containing protein [Frondihabitans sp. PhB188]ROQ40807.1 transcriptional regulator [Frondihabitans sp. PhB188]